ncbi:MAG: 6,7-dimethyl-8-ribityllumazine synthase [Gammaproteobacteria bacterium]|nr:6,7-dimethyl-8-ribityllumazine synthase [Gammaproteobacteria bacterium]
MTTNSHCHLSEGKRIAFIQAGWHKNIVEQGRLSFETQLLDAGVHPSLIDLVNVPGSLEIPLQCQLLAKTGQYQIIVAAGLIVDGGIYRHDFVASTVLDAMMKVSLQTEVPILSMVLTPHHFSDHSHHEYFYEHFKVKGMEAGSACI